MTGWTYIRWWHYLTPGKVARLRANNRDYMEANSFEAYRRKVANRPAEQSAT